MRSVKDRYAFAFCDRLEVLQLDDHVPIQQLFVQMCHVVAQPACNLQAQVQLLGG
ncbi:hypothetical protein D3C76_1636050 [compost metagenome]